MVNLSINGHVINKFKEECYRISIGIRNHINNNEEEIFSIIYLNNYISEHIILINNELIPKWYFEEKFFEEMEILLQGKIIRSKKIEKKNKIKILYENKILIIILTTYYNSNNFDFEISIEVLHN